MIIVDRPEVLVVGYAVRTSAAAEADPALARSPGLWARAGAPGAFAHVPGRVDENLYAVLTDYESAGRGAYTQIVGTAVHTAARLPEGMVAVRVPGVPAMLFEARGPMPDALRDAWQQVGKHVESGAAPARAFTTDLEIHHLGGVDLYVATLPSFGDPTGPIPVVPPIPPAQPA
ncbi:effector binding domain-containing protein [Microbispora sp. RL4-1S]|uniref:Effector binding domain-containing protein n=1 Tax=Microbispora oryzae TaxID=2806554 RepID=A0A940WMM5_9ACTN|nr:effector binding domain-containing protein [Microbispora oryzae]MBP2706652.1 effector binding domain-containing protein [Microbispora oryzae]